MSMLEGLASTLAEMSFVQLALVFLAVGAYSIAINGSFGGQRSQRRSQRGFVSGVAFAALHASWISGVVFLALWCSWSLSSPASPGRRGAARLGAERGAVSPSSEERVLPSACRRRSRARPRRQL